jgi:hypothetical protein
MESIITKRKQLYFQELCLSDKKKFSSAKTWKKNGCEINERGALLNFAKILI